MKKIEELEKIIEDKNKTIEEYKQLVIWLRKCIRLKDAEKFMDDTSIPLEKREKWIPQLQELMRDMGKIAKEFKLTEEEMLNGII